MLLTFIISFFFIVFSLCLKLLLPLLLPLCCQWHLCALELHIIKTYHGPHLDGANSGIRSAWCHSAVTAETEGHQRCCWPHHYAQMLPQAYANYAMGPPQVSFFFRVEPLTYLLKCLLWCMLSAFRCHAGCHIHQWGLNCWLCTTAALQSIPMAGICASWWWSSTTWGMHQVAAPSTALSRGSLLPLIQLASSHSNNMVGHTVLGAWQRVT